MLGVVGVVVRRVMLVMRRVRKGRSGNRRSRHDSSLVSVETASESETHRRRTGCELDCTACFLSFARYGDWSDVDKINVGDESSLGRVGLMMLKLVLGVVVLGRGTGKE